MSALRSFFGKAALTSVIALMLFATGAGKATAVTCSVPFSRHTRRE